VPDTVAAKRPVHACSWFSALSRMARGAACLRGFLCRAVGAFLCLECPTVNALLVSDPCVSMLPAPLERAWTCTHVAVHITLGALPRHVPRRVWVDYGRRTHNTYRITSVCDGYVAGVCYEVVMSLSKKMHNL